MYYHCNHRCVNFHSYAASTLKWQAGTPEWMDASTTLMRHAPPLHHPCHWYETPFHAMLSGLKCHPTLQRMTSVLYPESTFVFPYLDCWLSSLKQGETQRKSRYGVFPLPMITHQLDTQNTWRMQRWPRHYQVIWFGSGQSTAHVGFQFPLHFVLLNQGFSDYPYQLPWQVRPSVCVHLRKNLQLASICKCKARVHCHQPVSSGKGENWRTSWREILTKKFRWKYSCPGAIALRNIAGFGVYILVLEIRTYSLLSWPQAQKPHHKIKGWNALKHRQRTKSTIHWSWWTKRVMSLLLSFVIYQSGPLFPGFSIVKFASLSATDQQRSSWYSLFV